MGRRGGLRAERLRRAADLPGCRIRPQGSRVGPGFSGGETDWESDELPEDVPDDATGVGTECPGPGSTSDPSNRPGVDPAKVLGRIEEIVGSGGSFADVLKDGRLVRALARLYREDIHEYQILKAELKAKRYQGFDYGGLEKIVKSKPSRDRSREARPP